MKTKTCLVILLLAVSASAIFAQKSEFAVYGGGAFPVGKWADAGASSGFDVGFKYQYNLPVKGLGVFGTFDVIFNGLTKDAKNIYNNINDVDKYDTYKRITPKTLNFPIMAGVNYRWDFNDKVGIWAETALGVNICKTTNYRFRGTIESETVSSKYYYSYDKINRSTIIETKAYANCAYQLGVGAIFWQHMSVGVHFYVFGGADKIETETYETTTHDSRYRIGKDSQEKHSVKTDKSESEFASQDVVNSPFFCIRLGYVF
ncbi:MAG: hypothetical protein ACI30J_03930 [Paludibacteraceae bacterium]